MECIWRRKVFNVTGLDRSEKPDEFISAFKSAPKSSFHFAGHLVWDEAGYYPGECRINDSEGNLSAVLPEKSILNPVAIVEWLSTLFSLDTANSPKGKVEAICRVGVGLAVIEEESSRNEKKRS
jgi:hypothetical protein